jgi:hypothetical protein
LNVRTYSFRVVDAERKEREFILSIPNQSLMANHFKCQDVPDLCFSKLKQELSCETEEQAVPLQMTISEAELQKYIQERYPAKRKLFKPW